MKKIIYSILVIGLLTSCGKSVEKDAQTIANFLCLKLNADKNKKKREYSEEIDKIIAQYSGEDRANLEIMAKELFEKKCQTKSNNNDSTSSSNTDDYSENTNSATNMDELLDDYESYVDQYIKMYKKAMNGDVSAMSEYPALMEKAQNFEKSVNEAERGGRLTTEQIKRMNSINMKMIDAMPDTSNIPDMSGY
ncbi:hypothetical protein HZP70_00585 [Elizabethkingia anophelis]|nr:hypothetical protein [Elizabethkingia anophelis]MCT3825303.1 hypothetical protein [Elizabethkingia anophelis]MCT3836145.1 hypothetical protein [Elizabethkingia anophelis]MCT3839681.1 hypothetical protein [Elizabethkingia anophelis]MCT3846949.1 hypothetical protein [Elizabethkingia anophelis]